MKLKIPKLTCKRCGHIWIPRTDDVRICPRCKSLRWDRPKTGGVSNTLPTIPGIKNGDKKGEI